MMRIMFEKDGNVFEADKHCFHRLGMKPKEYGPERLELSIADRTRNATYIYMQNINTVEPSIIGPVKGVNEIRMLVEYNGRVYVQWGYDVVSIFGLEVMRCHPESDFVVQVRPCDNYLYLRKVN